MILVEIPGKLQRKTDRWAIPILVTSSLALYPPQKTRMNNCPAKAIIFLQPKFSHEENPEFSHMPVAVPSPFQCKIYCRSNIKLTLSESIFVNYKKRGNIYRGRLLPHSKLCVLWSQKKSGDTLNRIELG